MNKRRSRLWVTFFLGGLLGFCLLFTFGLSPYLRAAAERSDAFNMLGKCMEIVSADVLVVMQNGEARRVRLLGIEAPRREGEPGWMEQAARLEADPFWLARQGEVARNTLAAWVYRRGLHMTYPLGEEATDGDGAVWAYAEVAGVDLARKLLQGGQVYAVAIDHPRRETYDELEQQARDRQVGIWRTANSHLL